MIIEAIYDMIERQKSSALMKRDFEAYGICFMLQEALAEYKKMMEARKK